MNNEMSKLLSLEIINRYEILIIIILFPLWLQIHLEITLIPLIGAIYLLIAPYCAVALLIVCITLAVIKSIKRRSRIKSLSLLVVPIYFYSAIIVGEMWTERQYEQNKINGTKLARALEKYHEDKGEWPDNLSVLEGVYLADFPKWRYGFLGHDFIYWIEAYDNKPMLKFPKGAWTGVFYSFRERKWRNSTL
jgi:hypothetical protein